MKCILKGRWEGKRRGEGKVGLRGNREGERKDREVERVHLSCCVESAL